MSDELITQDNLSKEFLKGILDAAFMNTSFDSDGDLMVREDINCWVLPSKEYGRITLLSLWGFKSGVSQIQRLECVNQINKEYIVVKAIVGNNNSFRFEYDILIAGGITKKTFILALKRFCSIPRAAVTKYGVNLID